MGIAVVAPSLRGFLAGRRVADAVDQLVALTRYARSQAAADANVYRIQFGTGDGTYWLLVLDGQSFRPLGTEMGRIFTLPQEARLELTTAARGSETVDFYPDGRSDMARIRITGERGEDFLISSRSPGEDYEAVSAEEANP
jgi:Tfp pilus assembly protein FimT